MQDAAIVRMDERIGNLHAVIHHRAGGSLVPPMTASSRRPSRYSITMNGRPSGSPISKMAQMFGWFIADAARASWRSCERGRFGSRSVRTTFTATVR